MIRHPGPPGSRTLEGWVARIAAELGIEDHKFEGIRPTFRRRSTQAERDNDIRQYLLNWRAEKERLASEQARRAEIERQSEERAERKASGLGVVYFIQGEDGGNIKIGWSGRVEGRRKDHQCSSPVRLVVLTTMPGRREDEAELHRRFSHLRQHGEWFAPAPDLVAYIGGLQGQRS